MEQTQADAPRALRDATVLIVGVGALGCPAALHLAAAGIGRLVLADPDRVELSNLHRQLLHRTSAIGMAKTESAAARLRARYPDVAIDCCTAMVTPENLPALLRSADFVIDATDGVDSKFLLNDGAVRSGRPLSHAGILGFVGQTLTILPGRSTCYRCLFPEPPPRDEIPTCRAAGVLGPVAGVIGAIQASEAIRTLAGGGAALADRLLTFDGLRGQWRHVRLARNPRCPVCAAAGAAASTARGGTSSLAAPHTARYGS
jgi:molybdopterin/thiamine biosynthesis adenylyltransferase